MPLATSVMGKKEKQSAINAPDTETVLDNQPLPMSTLGSDQISPRTETLIMFAVWTLTERSSRHVPCEEIAAEIARHSEKRLTVEYISKRIRKLQRPTKAYDTFEVGYPSTDKKGRKEHLYRLAPATVCIPQTAWIVLTLEAKSRCYHIPLTAVQKTTEEAVQYGLSLEVVQGRIGEAVKSGYLKEIEGFGYECCERFVFEKDYLTMLAKKIGPVDSTTPTRDNPPPRSQ